jgi:hypothetical protein
MPRKGGKTQKKRGSRRASKQVLTIPELRKSMEHISAYTEGLIRSGSKSTKELASKFAAEWKKVFGKTLSTKTAESYIKHLMSFKKGTRRKQRGGAQLTGAPLDYMTRPGVPLPYGNYLEYVKSGFWNPTPAIQQDCGRQVGILPSADVNTNVVGQGGGGLLDSASQAIGAAMFRPFVAQNPNTPQLQAMYASKGMPLGPGPESWQQAWTPKMSSQPLPPLTALAVYDRTMASDVKTR